MLVCGLVAGRFGLGQQRGDLLDSLSSGRRIDVVAGGIPGDGFSLPEPAVRCRRNRPLGGGGEVGGQRVDGVGRIVGRWFGWLHTVSSGGRSNQRGCCGMLSSRVGVRGRSVWFYVWCW